jgi:hypothetical protein
MGGPSQRNPSEWPGFMKIAMYNSNEETPQNMPLLWVPCHSLWLFGEKGISVVTTWMYV